MIKGGKGEEESVTEGEKSNYFPIFSMSLIMEEEKEEKKGKESVKT